jgi:voltage-gated potassium channel
VPVYTIQPDREVEEFVRSLWRQFAYSIAALIGIVVISTVGFVVFGAERYGHLPVGERFFLAYWDTLNLVSTVGSLREDFTTAQRTWAILVIVFGLGAVLAAFSTIMGLLQGGDVRQQYVRRKMQRTLNELRNHIIICGFGEVGQRVAADVRKAGHDLVIIDRDPAAAEAADVEGYLVIRADCTRSRTLHQAGAEWAAGLIATLSDDATNVYLILIARELRGDLRIVTRADRDETRNTLRRAGADRVIVPSEIAGLQLSHLILRPRVSEFIASAVGEGEYEFAEIAVADLPVLAGKSLRQLDLPRRHGAIVISIIDGEGRHTFNPSADRAIEPDDMLIVVCQEGGLSRIEAIG